MVLLLCPRYIEENYSKIRGVERELSNLTLELKLTSGPKKAGWCIIITGYFNFSTFIKFLFFNMFIVE